MSAQCNRCNSTDIPLEELALNKSSSNSWVLICKDCLKSLGNKWIEPGTLGWLGSYKGLVDSDMQHLLDTFKEGYGQKPEKTADNERRFKRHSTFLTGFVNKGKSENEILVVIKDLSKGGVKFVSRHQFEPADVAEIRIERKNTEGKDTSYTDTMEVIRVNQIDETKFEIGARFLSAETINSENQAKNKNRHNLLLRVNYKLNNESQVTSGAVLELGNTSAQLLIPDSIPVGNKFALQITGSSGAFAKKELSGYALVEKCDQVYPNNHEVIVKLANVKVKKKAV